MANEVWSNWPSGATIYYMVRNSSGQVWRPSTQVFETYGTASRDADDYDTPLTYAGGTRYQADFDTNIPAGSYSVEIFIQDGATAADTDTFRGSFNLRWTGSGVAGGTIVTSGTGIARGGILAFVNGRLRRSETDVDDEIQIVLDDLSQGPYLEATDTDQTLSNGTEYLAYPSNFFSLISIVLNDGSQDLMPLLPFPGGYKALQQEKGDTGDQYVSYPRYYAKYGRRFYLFPVPGQTYTAEIAYYKVHDQDVDTIEFADEWRRAIYFGVTLEVAIKRKMPDMIQIYAQRYADEKEQQRLTHIGIPRVVGL